MLHFNDSPRIIYPPYEYASLAWQLYIDSSTVAYVSNG